MDDVGVISAGASIACFFAGILGPSIPRKLAVAGLLVGIGLLLFGYAWNYVRTQNACPISIGMGTLGEFSEGDQPPFHKLPGVMPREQVRAMEGLSDVFARRYPRATYATKQKWPSEGWVNGQLKNCGARWRVRVLDGEIQTYLANNKKP